MKLTVRLTLDGIVRALRLRAHALADRLEKSDRPRSAEMEMRTRQGSRRRPEADHDSRRS